MNGINWFSFTAADGYDYGLTLPLLCLAAVIIFTAVLMNYTRLIGQLQLLLKQYVGVSQALIGENVTQTVIQTRHTNGCSIPNIIKRGNRYCLHFRLSTGRFFRMSLGSDSANRARFISSRLSMFISLVKSSKMEPTLLMDIVQKMKKLEQDDIDKYLLEIQAGFMPQRKNPLYCT